MGAIGAAESSGREGPHRELCVVMTAADASEFKLRATPERVAGWLRMCPQAQRAGKCDAVVTYYLDKRSGRRALELACELFHSACECVP